MSCTKNATWLIPVICGRTGLAGIVCANRCSGAPIRPAQHEVAFATLSELTAEKWEFSLGSKLMGQINLVQEAIPFINERGSFTLVSGVLNEEPIFAGVAGATVSGALEGFVRAAAVELPKGLSINLVNPTILKESEAQFGPFFLGMIPVEGWKVGQAYKRSLLGAQTGQVYKVD